MVDVMGNQLNIGDKVVIAWTNNLRFGIINEISKHDPQHPTYGWCKIGTYIKSFTSKQLIKI